MVRHLDAVLLNSPPAAAAIIRSSIKLQALSIDGSDSICKHFDQNLLPDCNVAELAVRAVCAAAAQLDKALARSCLSHHVQLMY